jgi:hypothetical protein
MMEKYYMVNEEGLKSEITKEEFKEFSNSIWYIIKENTLIYNESNGWEIIEMEEMG